MLLLRMFWSVAYHGFLVDRVDGEDSDVEVDNGSLAFVFGRPVLVVFLELSWQDVVKHQTCLRADPARHKNQLCNGL